LELEETLLPPLEDTETLLFLEDLEEILQHSELLPREVAVALHTWALVIQVLIQVV
jgi:hypothetical protein